MESLCRAGHANKLHHFCLGDRGQWHAICQRQEMNEAHLLCTGRFGRQSSEAAVAKRKAAEMQGPPLRERCRSWRAPGRARGPGEPPRLAVSVGLAIQRRNRETSPPSAPLPPREGGRRTRGCIPAARRARAPRGRRGLPAHVHGHRGRPRGAPRPGHARLTPDLRPRWQHAVCLGACEPGTAATADEAPCRCPETLMRGRGRAGVHPRGLRAAASAWPGPAVGTGGNHTSPSS